VKLMANGRKRSALSAEKLAALAADARRFGHLDLEANRVAARAIMEEWHDFDARADSFSEAIEIVAGWAERANRFLEDHVWFGRIEQTGGAIGATLLGGAQLVHRDLFELGDSIHIAGSVDVMQAAWLMIECVPGANGCFPCEGYSPERGRSRLHIDNATEAGLTKHIIAVVSKDRRLKEEGDAMKSLGGIRPDELLKHVERLLSLLSDARLEIFAYSVESE
jgi:hypothetical protein